MSMHEDFGETVIRELSLMYESLILLLLVIVAQQYLHCIGGLSMRSSKCVDNG